MLLSTFSLTSENNSHAHTRALNAQTKQARALAHSCTYKYTQTVLRAAALENCLASSGHPAIKCGIHEWKSIQVSTRIYKANL